MPPAHPFQEPVDWREMYKVLVARGGVKTVTPQEAAKRAKRCGRACTCVWGARVCSKTTKRSPPCVYVCVFLFEDTFMWARACARLAGAGRGAESTYCCIKQEGSGRLEWWSHAGVTPHPASTHAPPSPPLLRAPRSRSGAVLLDVRLADKAAARAALPSLNLPLYRPITGSGLAANIRRVGFAFFGIFGTGESVCVYGSESSVKGEVGRHKITHLRKQAIACTVFALCSPCAP